MQPLSIKQELLCDYAALLGGLQSTIEKSGMKKKKENLDAGEVCNVLTTLD